MSTTNFKITLPLPHHVLPCHTNSYLIRQGAQVLVCLLKLLSDGNGLGTMLLALAAFHALGGKYRLLGKAYSLEILFAAFVLVLHIHGIPCRKGTRDIHTLGSGHTIPASGTAHFLFFMDGLLNPFDNLEVFLGEASGLYPACSLAVLLYHFHGIHSR